MIFVGILICLASAAKKKPLKKAPKIHDNILYVTEQNMTLAFNDLPAVLLLVQLGQDQSNRFRTRSDFLSAAPALGTRCYFAVMDGDRNNKFVRSIKQRESRAILLYRHGKLADRYEGTCTTESVTNYAMSKTGIPFKTFDEYSVAQDFIESNKDVIVMFLEKTGGQLFEKYTQYADQLRDNYSFGLCPDPDIAEDLGVTKFPSLILYRSVDHSKIFYLDDLNEATLTDISEWVKYNSKPKFVPFEIQDQKVYYGGKPVLLFFTPVEEEARDESWHIISQLADTYGNSFNFTTIDAVTGNRFMTGLGFGRYADPACAILSYNRNGKLIKYLHGEEDPFDLDDLSAFIDSYLAKKLKPHIRSIPLPEEVNGSVEEINALNFVERAISSSENAIILYYESWDRIYTDFLPDYTQLADEFKNKSINNVLFLKFEVSDNDWVAGPDPKKTPCLYLFKSDNKQKPKSYTGKLKHDELANFLKQELDVNFEL